MAARNANDLNLKRAKQLLRLGRTAQSTAGRVRLLSEALLGKHYLSDPLTGSNTTAEIFTVSYDRYDCVTFIETVLALALVDRAESFPAALRRLRYRSGKVSWECRNHYMTEWIQNNIRSGSVRRIRGLSSEIRKSRRLTVPGLVARRVRFSCTSKTKLLRQSAHLQSGDLIFFVSVRNDLDVFHCGILVEHPAGPVLRHASRRRGKVVDERLAEFLKRNRMAGAIVVRPQEAT